jgi:hypothetical protein
MHASLTDAITCPRCGPDYGLILLADKTDQRRIIDGSLGCANCRERFPVRAGFADLRFGAVQAADIAAEPSQEETMRLAGLLGVTEGPALVLIAGAGAVNARAYADLVAGIEVVAAWPPLINEPDQPGVSRFATAGNLPFRSGSMRGVALTDALTVGLIEEAARVAALRARVVVYDSAEGVREHMERARLRVIAQNDRATVAERVLL